MIVAINLGCKPVFPLILPDGKQIIYRSPLRMLNISESPQHSGSKGFQQLALIYPPVKGNITRVFLDLNEITQAIELLTKRTCGPKILTMIGDSRAQVLHRLCSLPDENDRLSSILHKRSCSIEEQDTSVAIYMICKKSALLYSALVVLPLPQTKTIRNQLTCDVFERMNKLREQEDSLLIAEILLWCTVIVGIAAEGNGYQQWFISKAWSLCRYLRIRSWVQLKDLLASFAWLDCASDRAGQAFWDKMSLEYMK